MRYAIISDVHANEAALRNALADIDREGVDEIVCLGDVVGYGPSPREAVALVRERCRLVVAGNHDDAVSGRGDASQFVELAGDAASRHREELGRDGLEWLKSLPYSCELEGGATAVHGDACDPARFYYVENAEDAGANFRATGAKILFVGHTHVPAIFVVGRSGTPLQAPPQDFTLEDCKRYIVNPGSIGYPRESDGKCLSSYVVYDSDAGTVTFRYLPFSVSSVMQRGRNPRRGKIAAAAAVAAALAAAALGAALLFGPKEGGREIGRHVLQLEEGSTGACANIELAKGSSPVVVKVQFLDRDGKSVGEDSVLVKKSSKKEFPAPAGAASAVFTALAAESGGKPLVESFNPAARPARR